LEKYIVEINDWSLWYWIEDIKNEQI
jgi:hypothetical protein